MKSLLTRPFSNSNASAPDRLHPAAMFGLFLWGLALTLVFIKAILEPGDHTVVDSYLLGADRWLDSVKLYSGPGGFIYTPTFALLFVPFTYLSPLAADLLWRLLVIGLYLWGSVRLIKHYYGHSQRSLLNWLGVYSLVAVPIAFSGFRNGQMNVFLIAVMLLIACQIIERKWTSAALLLALTMSLKPTFAVFFLLVTSLFKPLWFRVPPLLLGFLALPILFGGLDYGMAQYHNFVEMADSAMDRGMFTPKWASLFNISIQLTGYTVPEFHQTVAKLLLAVLTWIACAYAVIRHGTKNGLLYLLSLAVCYHLMFNPRSVNTDYILLGTMIGFWFTAAIHHWQDKKLAWQTGLIAAGVLFALDISRALVPDSSSWVNPTMALLFTILILSQLKNKRVLTP
ncbi:glycosyltransferase family 87 protein [Endozoicomonas sp. OPT23]|uniref:glycosyltransferase family 87 protein n=1 Tax=Endozoicomonas sp. OPT23 TaxID=2072845 RepID=UPI0018913FA4|nr:glycosyltransferase family 87 protein [Endozoicomonas sp. OPT23]